MLMNNNKLKLSKRRAIESRPSDKNCPKTLIITIMWYWIINRQRTKYIILKRITYTEI